jgi:hypothetical protein
MRHGATAGSSLFHSTGSALSSVYRDSGLHGNSIERWFWVPPIFQRYITFTTFLVDGSEVEWTLGMALSMNAEHAALGNAREQ